MCNPSYGNQNAVNKIDCFFPCWTWVVGIKTLNRGDLWIFATVSFMSKPGPVGSHNEHTFTTYYLMSRISQFQNLEMDVYMLLIVSP